MTKLYFTEIKSFVKYLPKRIKCNVCSIKLETKVMCLHKIRVEKVLLFHLKKCAVN